VTVE